MKKLTKTKEPSLVSGLLFFSKAHFVLIAGFIAQTIIYDASKLITPEIVLERWFIISGLLIINGLIWYVCKSKAGNSLVYKSLLSLMVISDILVASYFVYGTRGMASKAVMLYVIPLMISGLTRSRSAIFTTAILSIAAYSLTAISYFVINFNEGYKVELYGEIGFYSFLMLVFAGLLTKLLKSHE